MGRAARVAYLEEHLPLWRVLPLIEPPRRSQCM